MFKDQVEAGAKVLDKKIPDWLEKQDLTKLNLVDTCDCVVGQVRPDADYVDTLMDLFEEDDDQVALYMSKNYGFSVENWQDYPVLTKEWKAYIQERRTQKQTVNAE